MKKQQLSEHFYLINNILIDWNPLGVDGPILEEEYISIIPSLLKLKSDRNKLREFLRVTLDEKYGVNYNQSELDLIVDRINSL